MLPSVVGFGRFLIVYTILWSPLLEGQRQMPDAPPEDFTHVAYCELSDHGVVCGRAGHLWFIGSPDQRDSAVDEVSAILTSGAFDAWIGEHDDIESVLTLVHPGLIESVRSRINGAT